MGTVNMGSPRAYAGLAMATAERVLLEPAVQHIGVHPMGAGYRSNGCPRHLTVSAR